MYFVSHLPFIDFDLIYLYSQFYFFKYLFLSRFLAYICYTILCSFTILFCEKKIVCAVYILSGRLLRSFDILTLIKRGYITKIREVKMDIIILIMITIITMLHEAPVHLIKNA